MLILLVTEETQGWHACEIAAAFRRVSCTVKTVELQSFEFLIGDSRPGLRAQNLGILKPQGVFVRGIPGGSLEEVVFCLNVLHALEKQNAVVHNNAFAIERTVDKLMTSFLLSSAGIPTPRAWGGINRAQMLETANGLLAGNTRLVAKPVFGSQGKGVRLISSPADLLTMTMNSVCYLQEFIESSGERWQDWRIFLAGGKVISAMKRFGKSWVNNLAQGSDCLPAKPSDTLCRLARDATKLLGLAYAGVDIIEDREGKFWIIEINSIPAWKGLQSVSKINIADILATNLRTAIVARS